ncbi:MAG: M20 family metallopeptidase [Caldilineaceae bacterium]
MTTHISSQEILARAQELHEEIRAWRRDIHRHPELTFTEHRTAGLVNSRLIDLGVQTETEVAKTGVIGHIKGSAGPLVGLRADMDALPITEINGTEFDSLNAGIMHACGHDSHTAMLLGAATILKELADAGRLPGSVRLLFQPSEEAQDDEGKSGGLRMVEEGALDGLDAVFGIHVNPFYDTGHLATRPVPMLAAADKFFLTVRGFGGHAAAPHRALDPIVLAANVINAIHQIVSRRLDPIDSGVITVATINGGTVNNVIPDTVEMSGTIRSMTPAGRELLHSELRKACSIVEPLGGSFDLEIVYGYPPTVNAVEATEIMFQTGAELVGAAQMHEKDPVMGAEDFSYMAQVTTGCMFNIGVHDPAWGDSYYPLHRADFRLDENALPLGAAALATAAIRWMEKHG